jgi:hypothetical protein
MYGTPIEISSVARRLQDIMLGYLEAAGCFATWPGADGLTLDDALDSYEEAVAKGVVPDWQQLLLRHSEVDAELYVWLAAKDRWKFALRRAPPSQPGRADEHNPAQ